jgi:hypothetical protein
MLRLLIVSVATLSLAGCDEPPKPTQDQTLPEPSVLAVNDPKVLKLRTQYEVESKTNVTYMHLKYPRGGELETTFLAKKYDILVTDPSGTERKSGIEVQDGVVHVNVLGIPPTSEPAPDCNRELAADEKFRPRFWPIIRSRKVTVGAEGTGLIVEAFETPPSAEKDVLAARVFMTQGDGRHRVLIHTPTDKACIEIGQFVEVYIKAGTEDFDIQDPKKYEDVSDQKKTVEDTIKKVGEVKPSTPRE